MKKCSKCGIIVHDDFDVCPNCKSTVFANVSPESLNIANLQEEDSKQNEVEEINRKKRTSDSHENILIYKILEICGSAAALLGIFFPFIRVSFWGTVIERPFNEMAPDDHIIFVILAIIGLIGGIAGVHKLTVIIGMIYGVLLYMDTSDYFAKISSSEFGSLATKGFGFYCMVAGIILMIVFGTIADHMKHKR